MRVRHKVCCFWIELKYVNCRVPCETFGVKYIFNQRESTSFQFNAFRTSATYTTFSTTCYILCMVHPDAWRCWGVSSLNSSLSFQNAMNFNTIRSRCSHVHRLFNPLFIQASSFTTAKYVLRGKSVPCLVSIDLYLHGVCISLWYSWAQTLDNKYQFPHTSLLVQLGIRSLL